MSKRVFAVAAAVACGSAFVLGFAAQAGVKPGLHLYNETGADIVSLRLQPAAGPGAATVLRARLADGDDVTLGMDGGPAVCRYALHAVLAGGAEIDRDDVNLCVINDHTLVLRD